MDETAVVTDQGDEDDGAAPDGRTPARECTPHCIPQLRYMPRMSSVVVDQDSRGRREHGTLLTSYISSSMFIRASVSKPAGQVYTPLMDTSLMTMERKKMTNDRGATGPETSEAGLAEHRGAVGKQSLRDDVGRARSSQGKERDRAREGEVHAQAGCRARPALARRGVHTRALSNHRCTGRAAKIMRRIGAKAR